MNTTRATVKLGADDKELERDLRDARKKVAQFGKDTKKDFRSGAGGRWKDALGEPAKAKGGGAGKMLGKAWGAGKGLLGGAASLVGGGLGIQAAGGLVDMAGDLLAFEKSLTRFQITSGKSASSMAAFRSSVLDVSKATGVAQEEVLSGASTYVDLTGDVKGAESAMSSFARIAQASGATVSDVATATAALQQSMGLNPADIEKVFSGLISQGKMGSVSLKDFAGELSALAPKFAKFGGGTGNDAILNLGAALQAARQGFGSASEAATGLEALTGALSQNAKKFTAAGVKIFTVGKDGKKSFRSFNSIIEDIGKSKLANDPTLLSKAFGSKEAMQAYDMLSRNKGLLEQMATAGQDAGAVQRDLDTYQQSAAGKIEAAWNGVKIALAEAFTPERIAKFAEALVWVAQKLAEIIGLAQEVSSSVFDATEKYITKSMVGSAGSSADSKLARAGELGQMSDAQLKAMDPTGTANTQAARAAAQKELYAQAAQQSLGLTPEILAQISAAGSYEATNRKQVAGGGGGFSAENAGRMEAAVERGISKATIVVKTDANTIATTVANAPNARKPR